MNIPVSIVHAFTKDPEGGNPAGVVVDADNLTPEQMQEIATKLGHAETAFVRKGERAHMRLQFFSPTQEVNLCAHATLAACHTLMQRGQLEVKEHRSEQRVRVLTNAGPKKVTCHPDGLMELALGKATYISTELNRARIAALLGMTEEQFLDQPIETMSVGVPKVIIPVRSLDALMRINPDLESMKTYSQETGSRGFYPYAREVLSPLNDYHARQFNPLAGINEDRATGVAAGALMGYILRHNLTTKNSLYIEQGHSMGSPSELNVSSNIHDSVNVGGYAVTVDEKTVRI